MEGSAYPDEPGQRVSHAPLAEDRVWLFDPLNAPGSGERIADLGAVAGLVRWSYSCRRSESLFSRRNVAFNAES